MDTDSRQLFATAYRAEALAATGILSRGLTHANALELAHDACDRLDQLLASLPDTPALACRAKCSWCCYERVACSPPEAIAVAAFVQSRLVKRDRSQLVGRLNAHVERMHGLDASAKDTLRIACPFLSNQVCIVHKARPLVCRAWHSYDVGQCRSRWEGASAGVSVNGVRLRLRLAISDALKDAVEHSGPKHPRAGNLDLVAATRLIVEQPGTVDAWLSGVDAFAEVGYGERTRDREAFASE